MIDDLEIAIPIEITDLGSWEGIIIGKDNAKGVILKGVDKSELNIINFFKNFLSKGNLENFNTNKVFIGSELAYNLNLKQGDFLSLMSSAIDVRKASQ